MQGVRGESRPLPHLAPIQRLFGPATKPGQTFHEDQKARTQTTSRGEVEEYGTTPTTLRMRFRT